MPRPLEVSRFRSELTRPRSLRAAALAVPPQVFESLERLEFAVPKSWRLRIPATKFAKAARVIGAPDLESAYATVVTHWEEPETLVIGAEAQDPVQRFASLAGAWPTTGNSTAHMLWLDLVSYLPDDILAKLDRAAMSASLETRLPFLDTDVVNFAWRLPAHAKIRGGTTKWVVRQLLHRYVPPSLVERPKAGFGVPLGAWLRGPLRPWAEHLLSVSSICSHGVLRAEPVRRAWEQHLSGRRDLGYELWDVLCLEAWLERWGAC